MRQKIVRIGLALVLMFLFFTSVTFADAPWRTAETYDKKISEKLTFGVQNMMLGWTEVIVQPELAVDDGKNTWPALGRGIKNAVLDTIGGIFIIGTFLIPQINIPLPNGGVQT